MVETVGAGGKSSEVTKTGFQSDKSQVAGGQRDSSSRPAAIAAGTAREKQLVDSGSIVRQRLIQRETPRNYEGIQGVSGNAHVTPAFTAELEAVAGRLGAKPEHILAVMSFETGGTFDPAETNGIGATGLIQFLPSTARGLGTSTDALRQMTAVEQLRYVEKYFERFTGNLETLEKVYTAVLSGSPKNSPDDVLFRAGTRAYDLNPLDWNRDGQITAAEATTPVSARLFGGIENVQRALVTSGAVPDADPNRFADGQWGRNTAAAVAAFQTANGLPATGNLDEQTGRRLFGQEPTLQPMPQTTPPTGSTGLQRGQSGPAVARLQDLLIRLGEMTEAEKATGPGTFGPRTEANLRDFQSHAGIPVTGRLDAATTTASDKILAGLRIGERSPLIEAIQTRLVELGYLTSAQKRTGPGIFGSQTDAALHRFQTDNGLRSDGILGPRTYSAMFRSAGTTRPAPPTPTTQPAPGVPNSSLYNVASGVVITNDLAPTLRTIAAEYTRLTGGKLSITSGFRGAAGQASAMANLIVNNGSDYVRNLYANKTAVGEIIGAYNNGGVPEMTRVIERQVASGVYISSHLRSRAFDLSLGIDETVLRNIVTANGGTFLRETDHVHIQF